MSVEVRLPTDLYWSNGTLNGSISNPLKVAQNDPLFVGYPGCPHSLLTEKGRPPHVRAEIEMSEFAFPGECIPGILLSEKRQRTQRTSS